MMVARLSTFFLLLVLGIPMAAATLSGTFTVYEESNWCGTQLQTISVKEGQCYNIDGGSIKLDTSDPQSFPWSQWARSNCTGTADHKFAAGVCGFVDSPIGHIQHGVRFGKPSRAKVDAVAAIAAAALSGTFTVYRETNWCGTELQTISVQEGQCYNLDGGSIKLDTSDPHSFPWSQWAHSDCTGPADNSFAAGVCGFVDSPIGQMQHGVKFGTPGSAGMVDAVTAVTAAALSGTITVYLESNWCGTELHTITVLQGQCYNLDGGSIKLDTSDPHSFPWSQWAHSDCTGAADHKFASGVCGFVDSPIGQMQHGLRFGQPTIANKVEAVAAVPSAALSGIFTVYQESNWCGTKLQTVSVKEGQCYNLDGGSMKLDTRDPQSFPWSQWAHSNCTGTADHKFAAGVCGFVDSPIGHMQHGVRFGKPSSAKKVDAVAAIAAAVALSGTFTVYHETNWCGTELQTVSVQEGQCYNLDGGSIKLDASDPHSFPWSQWAHGDCTGPADHKFAAGVCGFVDSPIGQMQHGVKFGKPVVALSDQTDFVIVV